MPGWRVLNTCSMQCKWLDDFLPVFTVYIFQVHILQVSSKADFHSVSFPVTRKLTYLFNFFSCALTHFDNSSGFDFLFLIRYFLTLPSIWRKKPCLWDNLHFYLLLWIGFWVVFFLVFCSEIGMNLSYWRYNDKDFENKLNKKVQN